MALVPNHFEKQMRTGHSPCSARKSDDRVLTHALDGKRLATGSGDQTAKVWDAGHRQGTADPEQSQ